MNNQQTVLTTLGCAGSLAAMLAMTSPAIAHPAATALANSTAFDADFTLVQSDVDRLIDSLGCTCAICRGGVIQRPVL